MHLDKVVQLSCANIGFRDVKKQGLIALLEIGLMEGHFFCAMLEGILTLMELDLACVKSRSALSYLRKGFFCFKGSLLGHVLHLLALLAKGFTVLLVLLDHKMKSFKEIPLGLLQLRLACGHGRFIGTKFFLELIKGFVHGDEGSGIRHKSLPGPAALRTVLCLVPSHP